MLKKKKGERHHLVCGLRSINMPLIKYAHQYYEPLPGYSWTGTRVRIYRRVFIIFWHTFKCTEEEGEGLQYIHINLPQLT